MELVNFNIRLKEYKGKGWAVEIQKEKRCFLFFTKKYWVYIIPVSGMDDIPWYYKKYQTAIEEAKRLIGIELLLTVD